MQEADEAFQRLAVYAACFVIALPWPGNLSRQRAVRIRSTQFWATAKLSILWREWLTRNFIDSYLSHRAYYVPRISKIFFRAQRESKTCVIILIHLESRLGYQSQRRVQHRSRQSRPANGRRLLA